MPNVVVPQLGESVVEARVARWLKKPGEAVSPGEPIVELETEKIDLEVGAEQAGVLVEITRQEGEDVKVGEQLGVIDSGATATAASPEASTSPPRPEAGQPAARADAGASTTAEPARRDDPGAAATKPTRDPAPEPAATAGGGRATPTARKVARHHEVPLSRVPGTGEAGRIVKRDVEGFVSRGAAPGDAARPGADAAAPSATPVTPPAMASSAAVRRATAEAPPAALSPVPAVVPGERREERSRMSKRRLTIARNLVEAQQTAAMLTTFNEVDMTAVMALRERRKEDFRKRYGVGLGIASFFVKASIGALRTFPRLNAEIQGDEIVLKHYHDIGIAVGAAQGLVVPVLRDASAMSFAQIEGAIRDFARRANDGTLTLDDLRGGTFTITNGGVFGSLLSTPILNPPQVGILGLHKIEDRPVALDGQVVIRPMMYLALTYDHRLVDGLEAVQFLVRVKAFIEDPGHLLLEG